jgi:hypothetical protein
VWVQLHMLFSVVRVQPEHEYESGCLCPFQGLGSSRGPRDLAQEGHSLSCLKAIRHRKTRCFFHQRNSDQEGQIFSFQASPAGSDTSVKTDDSSKDGLHYCKEIKNIHEKGNIPHKAHICLYWSLSSLNHQRIWHRKAGSL